MNPNLKRFLLRCAVANLPCVLALILIRSMVEVPVGVLLGAFFLSEVGILLACHHTQSATGSVVEASSRNAIMGMTVRLIAHDIQSPLAAVKTLLGMKQSKSEDESALEEQLLQRIAKTEAVIYEGITLSDSDPLPIRPALVAELIESAKARIRSERGLHLHVECAFETSSPILCCDQSAVFVLDTLFQYIHDRYPDPRGIQIQVSNIDPDLVHKDGRCRITIPFSKLPLLDEMAAGFFDPFRNRETDMVRLFHLIRSEHEMRRQSAALAVVNNDRGALFELLFQLSPQTTG